MSESLERRERLDESKPPERAEQVERDLGSVSELDSRKALETARVTETEPVDGTANEVHKVILEDGRIAYYKPEAGEDPELRMDSIPPYQMTRREIAACDVDRAIGVGLVPDTVERRDLGRGPGSLQAEAPLPGRQVEQYSELDRQELAAFDYLVANTDRHAFNCKTFENGRPAAIDNGACFPENDQDGIRSGFVNDQLGKPLDPGIVERYRNVDERHLGELLRARGIGEEAIDGFNARLEEIRRGQIDGDAWDGEFLDDHWNVIRPRKSEMSSDD